MVTVQTFFKRTGICLFWIAAVFAFLYTPRFLQPRSSKRSINVCMWPGVVDPKTIAQFERESGITVNYSSFDGNEELLVKLFATKGRGYDLIVTSDYCVELLIKEKLLKKIDTKKLNFWNHVNPAFLNHYFDPGNQYSIPSDWYVLGFGIRKDAFPHGLASPTWSAVFDLDHINYKLGLINDSRELASLAMNYLYKEIRPLSAAEVDEMTALLKRQKKHVEAYTDFRGDFLLKSGNCALVLVANSFIWSVLEEDPSIDFILPQDGVFLNMENFVIPALSDKADLTYQFINFLFRLDIQEHNFSTNAMLSVRDDADFMINNPYLASSMALINAEVKPELFVNTLTDDQINTIWLSMKGGL